MNPAFLLVFLLLTPTQLREDKDFLKTEIDVLEESIIEIEKLIREKDIEIGKKNVDLKKYFETYKELKKELRLTDTRGDHYEGLQTKTDEEKKVYNDAVDQLKILTLDRKALYSQLSTANLDFQLKTVDLEQLEKIKPRAPSNWISITLSKTCQQLINNNMSTNCPSYSQISEVYDNTIPNVSGAFVETEFDVKRENPPLKEGWKYYSTMMKGEKIIAVDPDAEFMQRSTIVEIQSNSFTTHSLFGSSVGGFVNGTIPMYKNIKISNSCDSIITAPDFESVAFAVKTALNGCTEEIKPSGYILQQFTPLDRPNSTWYKFNAWLTEIKETCLILC